MNQRLADIRARRERLLLKSAAQRDEVAQLVTVWHGPLGLVDRGIAVGAYVRSNPGVVLLPLAIIALLSPRRSLRWARRSFVAWRGYRWVTNLLARFAG